MCKKLIGVCWALCMCTGFLPQAEAQCPAAGSCFEVHATPGCEDAACCATVCANDPFCCSTEWDSLCVSGANALCGGGGNPACPGTGDCFASNGTPGCEDETCCNAVCAIDSFCCDTFWDSICADEAVTLCGGGGAPENDDCNSAAPISGTGIFAFNSIGATTDGPDHASCLFFGQSGIANDIWYCWTASCTDTVTISTCGLTGMDSKIAVYDGCGCPVGDGNLLACNDDICGLQSTVSFSATTGNSYLIRIGNFPGASAGTGSFSIGCAGGGNPACPGAGNCFVANGSPGCEDGECCNDVCAIDAFCCASAWDEICAGEAEGLCGGAPTEACCLIGDCFDMPAATCSTLGGVPQGFGTSCAVEGCGGSGACPGTGSCFVSNGTPGCDDEECCNTVCAIDPFCCDVTWDGICAQEANDLCGGGGDACPGEGSCFENNGTPGCEDETCCETVCAIDSFCCNFFWDQICADEAAELCGEPPCRCPADVNRDGNRDGLDVQPFTDCLLNPENGPGLPPSSGCGCADADVDGDVDMDDIDRFVSYLLDSTGECPVCGPGNGDCFSLGGNGSPGCEDEECCASVCAEDPFCCEVVWDGVCAAEANVICNGAVAEACCLGLDFCVLVNPADCTSLGGQPQGFGLLCEDVECTGPVVCGPGAGDCFTANGTPGCDDATCCATVCAIDSFCCDVFWDGICAGEAAQLCDFEPADNDSCENATPISGSGTFNFNNLGTTSVGPDHALCNFFGFSNIENDVWFCWTADCTDLVTLSTCGLTTVDTKIAVYNGCACPEGDESILACNDDACFTFQSSVNFNATLGNTYLIRIGTYPGAAPGSGSFTISCGGNASCPGTGDCYVANGTVGCQNEDCCNTVCAIDPFCCNVTWDGICADEAVELCPISNPSCPGEGSCFEAHATPGCDNADCCNAVCAAFDFCCDPEGDGWTQDCVDLTALFCIPE